MTSTANTDSSHYSFANNTIAAAAVGNDGAGTRHMNGTFILHIQLALVACMLQAVYSANYFRPANPFANSTTEQDLGLSSLYTCRCLHHI